MAERLTTSVLPEVRERPCTFGRGASLVGIVTYPADNGVPCIPVVILGAGIIHKVGPSRVAVELARDLALAGHITLRFDLSGIGDSPRPAEPRLEDSVVADIRDAISLVLEEAAEWPGGVGLIGFCSGADNGLHVAGLDPRVTALALFDPTVHETRGFRRRRLLRHLRSMRSWLNLMTGRSLWLRARESWESPHARPPGFYGLLAQTAEKTDTVVSKLVERGVQLLYVLSSHAHSYCNSPLQVGESLQRGYSPDHFTVVWRPDMDHILSAPGQRAALSEVILGWLQQISAAQQGVVSAL